MDVRPEDEVDVTRAEQRAGELALLARRRRDVLRPPVEAGDDDVGALRPSRPGVGADAPGPAREPQRAVQPRGVGRRLRRRLPLVDDRVAVREVGHPQAVGLVPADGAAPGAGR